METPSFSTILTKLSGVETENEEELTFNEKFDQLSQGLEAEDVTKKISLLLDSNESLQHSILNLAQYTPLKLPIHVYENLNFWENNSRKGHSIESVIDRTKTISGKNVLRWYIENPTDNVSELVRRQRNMRRISEYYETPELTKANGYRRVRDLLGEAHEHEKNIAWFWQEDDELLESMMSMIFFSNRFLVFLNRSSIILQLLNMYKIVVTPLIAILYPLITLFLPLLALRFMGYPVSFSGLLSLIKMFIQNKFYSSQTGKFSIFSLALWLFMYLQGINSAVVNAKNVNRVINLVHVKLNQVATLVKGVSELTDLTQKMGLNICSFASGLGECSALEKFQEMFKADVWNNEPSLIENKGLILATYTKFQESKHELAKVLTTLGEIDYVFSMYELLCMSKHFTKPNYISAKPKQPILMLKNAFHPNLIENQDCVGNSISMGMYSEKKQALESILGSKSDLNCEHGSDENKVFELCQGSIGNNILVTGVNASGKSIFIKTLVTNVLLAQTIGVVTVDWMALTPFSLINTYLHIPDDTGHESLFEAEMHRSYEQIHSISKLSPKKYSLVIMDEIFSSTNYEEGYSAAYSVALRLANFPNSMSVITTHYADLTQVEQVSGKAIRNYMFKVYKDKEDNIRYDYKLRRGSSRQTIALELLAKNGFDPLVIELAMDTKNKLIEDRKRHKKLKKKSKSKSKSKSKNKEKQT